jgi:hypothetical protein
MRGHPGRWGALDLLENDLDEFAGRDRQWMIVAVVSEPVGSDEPRSP